MDIAKIAKALGSLGGKQRAKKLSSNRKKQIAQMGGRARAQSLQMAKRIEVNFKYVEVIEALKGNQKKVTRVKQFKKQLPGIYA